MFGILYRRHPAQQQKLENLMKEYLYMLEYQDTDNAEVTSGNGRIS